MDDCQPATFCCLCLVAEKWQDNTHAVARATCRQQFSKSSRRAFFPPKRAGQSAKKPLIVTIHRHNVAGYVVGPGSG
jgi:hypothetical protein